jgi:hypothetical protein
VPDFLADDETVDDGRLPFLVGDSEADATGDLDADMLGEACRPQGICDRPRSPENNGGRY